MRRPEPATAVIIVATCVVGGPAIGLLLLYSGVLLIAVGVFVYNLMVSAPMRGAGFTAAALGGTFFALPAMALVGCIFLAPLTFITGVALSLVHWLALSEKLHAIAPRLSLATAQYTSAFLVSLTVALAYDPHHAPRAILNLGPLSIPFAAAFSGGVCYLLALRADRLRRRIGLPQLRADDG